MGAVNAHCRRWYLRRGADGMVDRHDSGGRSLSSSPADTMTVQEDRARWFYRRILVFGLAICGQVGAGACVWVLATKSPDAWPVAAFGIAFLAAATTTAWLYIAHVHKADQLANVVGAAAEAAKATQQPPMYAG